MYQTFVFDTAPHAGPKLEAAYAVDGPHDGTFVCFAPAHAAQVLGGVRYRQVQTKDPSPRTFLAAENASGRVDLNRVFKTLEERKKL